MLWFGKTVVVGIANVVSVFSTGLVRIYVYRIPYIGLCYFMVENFDINELALPDSLVLI